MNEARANEARALDDRILAAIARWHADGTLLEDDAFEALALDLCRYQLAANAPYARFAATLDVTLDHPPTGWRSIPAVPSAAFKDATLTTFDPRRAELEFHTSGTTADRAGRHYLERAALYDAALLAGFDRLIVPDRPLARFLNLVPDPRVAPRSSLGYMMGHVSVLRGDGRAAWFLDGDRVDIAGLAAALDAASVERRVVVLSGTAFAFVAVLDAFAARGRRFSLPPGSRVMETGGFKGRSRVVERETLYDAIVTTFGIPLESIVAEYGMTELTSQFYDALDARSRSPRVKVAPPWLRTLVIDERGAEVPRGAIGSLRHVDLANRSSAIAIQTEDRGYAADGGIVLLGRTLDAPLRGCSLDAEDLRVHA